MNWLQRQLFKLRTGSDIEVLNNGEPVDEAVIKFKDFYISVLYADDEIHSLSWSDSTDYFNIPIRDILVAKKGKL